VTVVTNKRDFDVSVTLFEVAPDGTYFQLSHHLARASHIGDREHRRLLTPGQRHQLEFTSDRLTSRFVPAGSRLLVVLAVVKHQGTEINYGTGKPVRDETIADAGEPLGHPLGTAAPSWTSRCGAEHEKRFHAEQLCVPALLPDPVDVS
jgi:predicted acyl esterase